MFRFKLDPTCDALTMCGKVAPKQEVFGVAKLLFMLKNVDELWELGARRKCNDSTVDSFENELPRIRQDSLVGCESGMIAIIFDERPLFNGIERRFISVPSESIYCISAPIALDGTILLSSFGIGKGPSCLLLIW